MFSRRRHGVGPPAVDCDGSGSLKPCTWSYRAGLGDGSVQSWRVAAPSAAWGWACPPDQEAHNFRQSTKVIAAYRPANKSSARMPHPCGNFSSLRAGQGLITSKSLNKKKPPKAGAHQIGPLTNEPAKANVIAWPAISSATTSFGSVSPVAAIEAGAHLTQMTEPASVKTTMMIVITVEDTLK